MWRLPYRYPYIDIPVLVQITLASFGEINANLRLRLDTFGEKNEFGLLEHLTPH